MTFHPLIVVKIQRKEISMTITRKNYPQLAEPVGAYVHTVSHNGLLYLSGLTAFGTSVQKGDLAQQAEAVFNQIQSILSAEGIGFERILKITIFVTEVENIKTLRQIFFKYYNGNLPASSLVQVKGLFSPDLKIEVEALAALN
jgi:2-iminobutanoate/2-iminopropanoate deaminase